jgi:HEAT repeat protein
MTAERKMNGSNMNLKGMSLIVVATWAMCLVSAAQDEPIRVTIPPWRIEALLAALDDPSIEVQRAAIHWLAEKDVSDQRLGDKIGSFLTDNRWNKDRTDVLAALVSVGKDGTKFAPQVAGLLKDPDRDVRNSAVKALGLMGEAGAEFAPQVAAMREDPDSFIASSAVEALERMGKTGAKFAAQVADLLKVPVISREHSGNSAVSFVPGIAGVEPPNPAKLLENDDPEVRIRGINMLAKMGEAGAKFAPQVADLLKDQNSGVRESAANALGEMGEAGAKFAPQVADLLKDQNSGVRESAANALGEMGEVGANFASKVADLLEDPNRDVRGRAVDALSKMGEAGAEFAPQVANLLEDTDEDNKSNQNIRCRAVKMLGLMGASGAKFAPQVADLLKDRNPFVRGVAAETLGLMGASGAKFAPQVAFMLKDRNHYVQDSAAKALGSMGEAGAIVVPQVADLLKDRDPNIQSSAAEALGSMGEAGAEFASQVAELLKISNLIVLRSAVPPPKSVPGRDEEPDKDPRIYAVKALVRMGEAGAEFAPRIAEMLRDSDVQESALNALEQFRQKVSSQVIFGCAEAAHTDPQQYSEFLLKAYLACGVSDENLVLVRWLGNRDQHERPTIDLKDHAARLTVLNVMHEALPRTARFPKTQKEMTEIISYLARAGSWNLTDIATLTSLKNDLKDYPDQAGAIQTAIDGIQSYHRLKTYGGIVLGHAIFWFTLIVAYPRSRMVQGFFFWNKWPRRMFGLWYVGFLITVVPWLRRRMFAPFKEVLVPANLLGDFDPATYFTDSEVVAKKPGESTRLHLKDVLGEIKGQTVLEGQSGLGKTMLLLHLARKAKSTVVYVRAVECKKGVVAAIQGKLQGQAQDEKYLKTLIYAGAVDVLIDGLNEATPDTRARITKDVQDSFKGNFIVATQALDWEPPATARVYVLKPLRPMQIEAFQLQQWPSLAAEAKVTKEEYDRANHEYLARILNEAQGQDTDDARLVVLSNPMEAMLAAELISKGEVPDLFRLVEQQYDAMAKEFEEQNSRPFPLISFAERVYDWKDSGNPYISVDGFELEFQSLVKHKLLLQREERLKKETSEEEVRRWFFRHDKITDFFLVPAFRGDHSNRRIEQVKEERFSGVYELMAVRLPLNEAQELHKYLVDWAAQTENNGLLNRYTRAMKLRHDTPRS